MSITDLDFMILDAIQKIRNSFLDSFFATITHLGDSGILAILIAILLIFGMKKKYRQTGISLAFALVIAFVLGNLILKNVIARPRPCWVRESIGADCGAEGLLVPFRTHACVGSAGCGAVA